MSPAADKVVEAETEDAARALEELALPMSSRLGQVCFLVKQGHPWVLLTAPILTAQCQAFSFVSPRASLGKSRA